MNAKETELSLVGWIHSLCESTPNPPLPFQPSQITAIYHQHHKILNIQSRPQRKRKLLSPKWYMTVALYFWGWSNFDKSHWMLIIPVAPIADCKIDLNWPWIGPFALDYLMDCINFNEERLNCYKKRIADNKVDQCLWLCHFDQAIPQRASAIKHNCLELDNQFSYLEIE